MPRTTPRRRSHNRRRNHHKKRGGGIMSPECPYPNFPVKCSNKAWCVTKQENCNSTTADILLDRNVIKAFRKPMKLLLFNIEKRVAKFPESNREYILDAARQVAMAVDQLVSNGVTPDLSDDVIQAIERLDDSVFDDIDNDMDLIKKAFGDAIDAVDRRELDDDAEIQYDVQEADIKEILESSVSNIETIQNLLRKISSNLEAASAR